MPTKDLICIGVIGSPHGVQGFIKIKNYSDLPVMAGFGIKSTDDARTLAECSDGIVIGSSIVQMIDEESKSKEFGRISNYLKEMKAAIS